MDKTVAGMIGAVAALSAAIPAEAATDMPVSPDAVTLVRTYADLLRPIPNAAVLLATMDAAEVRPVDDYYADDHHHHHRRYYRRRQQHHHHHASAAQIIERVLGDVALS